MKCHGTTDQKGAISIHLCKRSVKVSEYIQALKLQASKCQYRYLLNEELVDQLILVIRDLTIRKKLLAVDNLGFENATLIAFQHELTERDSAELSHSLGWSPRTVNKIDPKVEHKCNCECIATNATLIRKCYYCASSHPKGHCPVYNKICDQYYAKGHFKNYCEQVKT